MYEYQLPSSALPLTRPYLDASLAGDAREALRLTLDVGLATGLGASQLELRMIVPAQHELGRLWQINAITVAQEHLATSISQLVISHLYPHLARGGVHGRLAVVACVEGELHDLGARMGADFLETGGFEVRYLGADVSATRLLDALAEGTADLLGLSATLHSHGDALRSAVQAVRAAHPSLPIVVGGGLLEKSPGLAEELAVQAWGTEADQLTAACRRLLAC